MNRLQKFYYYQTKRDYILKRNLDNIMEIPELKKMTLSNTLALGGQEEKLFSPNILSLEKISHQKPKKTYAKKSIAEFTLRKGQLLGCKVTLRALPMYELLDNLVVLVFPQIPDYTPARRIASPSGKDCLSYTIGFNQLSFFPEIERDFDIIELVKGMNLSFSTSAKTSEDLSLVLTSFRFPLANSSNQ